MLNVFITIYSRVNSCHFFVLNEVLFLDFHIHTGKLFSSVPAFILYKNNQSSIGSTFIPLFLCDFFYPFFFRLKKNFSLLAPLPWLILLETQ